jgi:hypothetical protein
MSTMFRLNNNIQVDHRLVKRGVSDYKNVLLECIDCIVLLHANVLCFRNVFECSCLL